MSIFQTSFDINRCLAGSWEVFLKTKAYSRSCDGYHVFDLRARTWHLWCFWIDLKAKERKRGPRNAFCLILGRFERSLVFGFGLKILVRVWWFWRKGHRNLGNFEIFNDRWRFRSPVEIFDAEAIENWVWVVAV